MRKGVTDEWWRVGERGVEVLEGGRAGGMMGGWVSGTVNGQVGGWVYG